MLWVLGHTLLTSCTLSSNYRSIKKGEENSRYFGEFCRVELLEKSVYYFVEE